MQGKRALVTGGSAGLGAAVAFRLASEGVKCAINYNSDAKRAEDFLKRLPGAGHVLVRGSPFTEEGAFGIVKDAIEGLGGLDYVASNAGWTRFGVFNDLKSVSSADWDQCFVSNVKSHLWIVQAAQPELKKNRGAIVITASVAGIRPSGSSMAYAVSKGAAIHLAKSLAKACAPEITVNSVSPGVLMTDWGKNFTAEQIKANTDSNALGRLADVGDTADTYVSLLRTRSITGQNIEISAGFHL